MEPENEGHALCQTDELYADSQLGLGEAFISPGGEKELASMMRGMVDPVETTRREEAP